MYTMHAADTLQAPESACSASPFARTLCFQSSQPHLKKFIMFDQTGGKGRVFFHPALAHELFGQAAPPQNLENKAQGCGEAGTQVLQQPDNHTEQSGCKLNAYRGMISGAFESLESLRSLRQKDTASLGQPPCLNACGVSSSSKCSREAGKSQLSGLKRDSKACSSEIMHENSEDLDALLSTEDGSIDEDDDDVRSTGHSPDELSAEDSFGSDDELETENPCKRRKLDDITQMQEANSFSNKAKGSQQVGTKRSTSQTMSATRRGKIKRTVKALRRMIPGGAFLDATLVLDETIQYVKSLRDRVNQLEASRFQTKC